MSRLNARKAVKTNNSPVESNRIAEILNPVELKTNTATKMFQKTYIHYSDMLIFSAAEARLFRFQERFLFVSCEFGDERG